MPVEVTTDDGQQISARIYQLPAPGVIPAALRGMVQQPSAIASLASFRQCRYTCQMFPQFQTRR